MGVDRSPANEVAKVCHVQWRSHARQYRRRCVRVQVEIMEKRLTASFNARFNPCPPQRRGKFFSVIAQTGASLSRADDRLQVGADRQTDFLFVENGFVLGWTRLIKTDADAKGRHVRSARIYLTVERLSRRARRGEKSAGRWRWLSPLYATFSVLN